MSKLARIPRVVLFLELVLLVYIFFYDHRSQPTNPLFNSYILRFEQDLKTVVGDIPITFKYLPSGIAGQCIVYTNGLAEINVDPFFWITYSEIERTALIYHELVHCKFIVDHVDGSLSDGCISSIMNTVTTDEKCLKKHWKYYVEDLRLLTN